MDIKTLKLDLVEKIIHTEKTAVLVEIKSLLQKEEPEDWWDTLPHEVRESIQDGLQDIEKGNVFSHEQILQEARQKYGF